MSEEQLVAAAEEAVITADVDTDIELEEEEVQEQVSPEVAAFRADLASKPGDWYVVHSYAGFEKRVKGNLSSAFSHFTWRITSSRLKYLKKK